MEGASHGCPIVASLGYGGLGELIEHGRNGYLFNRHDVIALADAVVELARDPAHAAAIRDEARRTLETRYSPRATAQFYYDFFTR
jgi:glycosyltransferase involved in cell wall biosynthesis